MTSRRLTTKMSETAENTENEMYRVRRTENELNRNGCEAVVLKNCQHLKRREEDLVRDVIHSSLEGMVKPTDTKEICLSLENLYGKILLKGFRERALQSPQRA